MSSATSDENLTEWMEDNYGKVIIATFVLLECNLNYIGS